VRVRIERSELDQINTGLRNFPDVVAVEIGNDKQGERCIRFVKNGEA